MLTFSAPTILNGDALIAELAAAGVTDAQVSLVGDELRVVTDGARSKVEPVVVAHTGKPTSEQQARLDAARRRQTLAGKARAGTLTAAEQQEALALLLGR